MADDEVECFALFHKSRDEPLNASHAIIVKFLEWIYGLLWGLGSRAGHSFTWKRRPAQARCRDLHGVFEQGLDAAGEKWVSGAELERPHLLCFRYFGLLFPDFGSKVGSEDFHEFPPAAVRVIG